MFLENISHDLEDLIELNCFSSKSEVIQYMILDYMSRSKETVGSWALRVMLEYRGVSISVASVGRALIELDSKGYTESISTKGRIIAAKGREFLEEKKNLVEHELLQKRLLKSVTPQDYSELLDLVRARRSLEAESARLAAKRATDQEKKQLLASLNNHITKVACGIDPTNEAFDFHIKVAEASHSRFILATINLLIYYNEQLEYNFPYLVTRELGTQYNQDHQAIAEAIFQGEPAEAEKAMRLHMTNILEALKSQGKIEEAE